MDFLIVLVVQIQEIVIFVQKDIILLEILVVLYVVLQFLIVINVLQQLQLVLNVILVIIWSKIHQVVNHVIL